jgi:hypothetical protein
MITSLLRSISAVLIAVALVVIFYEGIPFARDIPFIGHIPVVGWVIQGEVGRRKETALEGFVKLSEKTTADAKAAEAKRQADINAQSAEEYRKKLAIVQEESARNDAAQDKEIADYEKQLDDEKRKCSLTRADIGTIMHNGTGKAAPVVKRKGPH